MAVYQFTPRRTVTHLDEGEYTGVVKNISFYQDKGYFVFDIQVDGTIFNTSFAISNIVFNNFAAEFVDENGCFDDQNLLDRQLTFTVKDVVNGSDVKSRIVQMKAV